MVDENIEDNINGIDSAPSLIVPKKLTDWKEEPTLAELKQDLLDAASDSTTHINKVNGWLTNLNVKSKTNKNNKKNRSAIQPKLIRKQAEWRYPALSEPFLSTDDVFKVSPITFEDKLAAQQNELVLNNQFNNKIDKVAFIDEYVRTAVDEGTVVVRVGWDFQEKKELVDVPQFKYVISNDPKTIQLHQELHALMTEHPDRYEIDIPDELKQAHELAIEQNIPIAAIPNGSIQEEQLVTIVNQPTVDICDYRSTVIDPTCKGNLKKANFIIYNFETSLSELKKNAKYKNLDNINLDTNSILGATDSTINESTNTFNFKDKPRKKFIAYEYWGYRDINGTGIAEAFVATWVGDTLIQMELTPFADQELPFVKVQYLPVRKSNFGEPDGELLIDNQNIIGAVTRGMIDIMGRSANGQIGTRKDTLDFINKRKFEKGEDYEYNPGVDPSNGFYMHTFPEIPRSAEYMLNQQNGEAESLTAIKAFSNGISGQALGNTATGVRSALDATSKRELAILRRMAQGLVEIGRKIISMNSIFLEDVEVVRITNEEFVPVKKDDLAGKFDLRLTISTAEADNQKAEELSFMLQTTAQTMGPEFSTIILSEIARLRKMPDLEKKLKDYKPTPDPMVQRKAELEVLLLEKQIATEEAKAAQYMSNAQLSSSRSSTEEAKAGNLRSDTDLKDLNYLEQESGTQQERSKELENTKHTNNREIKLMDHKAKQGGDPSAIDTTVSNGISGQ
jgi:hypothetical protein